MKFARVVLAALAVCTQFGIAGAAAGAKPGPLAVPIELSVVVTGRIEVAANGSVRSVEIDKEDALPEAAREIIRKKVPEWRFAPEPGRTEAVKATMSLRLVARKLDGGRYAVWIGSAGFDTGAEARARGKPQIVAPRYPDLAALAGVGGTVYVLAQVRADGSIGEAIAEQVNLSAIGSERQMARYRQMLEQFSLEAAGKWRFGPRSGPSIVRIPFRFVPPGGKEAGYGEWERYVPGPRHTAAWVPVDRRTAIDTGADAFGAGGFQIVDNDLSLLTPLTKG